MARYGVLNSVVTPSTHRPQLNWVISIVGICCVAIYLYLALTLRHGLDFNDETEKLVGSIMLHKGFRLYGTMFAHHGPFSYLVGHLFYVLTGSKNIATYRLIPIFFSLLAMISIAVSPVIKTKEGRWSAIIFFTLGISATQAIYGLVLGMYQIYAGYLVIIALALGIIPFLLQQSVTRLKAMLSGMALGFVFFCAYSFVVACFCIVASTVLANFLLYKNKPSSRQFIFWLLGGGIASSLVMLTWLCFFGDIHGYFVYHFYFNQTIYAKFSAFNPVGIFHFIVPITAYWTLPWPHPERFLTFILTGSVPITAALYLGLRGEHGDKLNYKSRIPFLVLFLGILFTYPRPAADYQANTLVIAIIAVMGILCGLLVEKKYALTKFLKISFWFMAATLAVSLLWAHIYSTTLFYELNPVSYYSARTELGVSQQEDYAFFREYVKEDETVAQLPYSLMFYLALDRLPVSGNYYYLPWQDAYFKNPISGYKIDICQDIETKKPKIIHYLQSKIWDYPTSEYLKCLEIILKENYAQSSILSSVWVRGDLLDDHEELRQSSILRTPATVAKTISSKSLCLSTGDRVHLTNCDSLSEKFYLTKTRWGQKLVDHSGLNCLEILPANGDTDEVLLRLWPCHSDPNQFFDIIGNVEAFKLKSKARNSCVSTQGIQLQATSCDEATSWKLQ